jgi:hypothetical protein
MSMFNWNLSDGSHLQISLYIWVYLAISVPLTITTLLIWRFWWKIEDTRYDRQIAEAREEYEVRKPYWKLGKEENMGNESRLYSWNYTQGLARNFWRGASGFFRYLTSHGTCPQTDKENPSAIIKKD